MSPFLQAVGHVMVVWKGYLGNEEAEAGKRSRAGSAQEDRKNRMGPKASWRIAPGTVDQALSIRSSNSLSGHSHGL